MALHFFRRWQIFDHRIQYRLHAFIFKRGTTEHGDNFIGQVRARMPALMSSSLRVSASRYFSIRVSLASAADSIKYSRIASHSSRKISGYLSILKASSLVGVIPKDGFHFNQVNDAFKFILGADCHLQGHRCRPQALSQLRQRLCGNRRRHGPFC